MILLDEETTSDPGDMETSREINQELVKELLQGGWAKSIRALMAEETEKAVKRAILAERTRAAESAYQLVVYEMASNVEEAIIAAAACVILCRRHRRVKRRFWVRPSLKAREKYSGTALLTGLERDDLDPSTGDIKCDDSFKNFCRMTSSDVEYLINEIGHKIGREDTTFGDAIPVRERLAVTLRLLASGDSYQSLSYLFKFSKQSISNIVPEVCGALIDCLSDRIIVPKCQEECQQIANDFDQKWNYPHCCGSIDGKHICLQAPINTGTDYFNYKGFFSIVLLAVLLLSNLYLDADYCFTFVNVRCQGHLSDGGVFANTTFKQLKSRLEQRCNPHIL